MKLPKRKEHRLKAFDYSLPGAYFITICTHKKENLFWKTPIADINSPKDIRLTACGTLVEQTICRISEAYPSIVVEHYIVMPDHIHLLLRICTDENGERTNAPKIGTVIMQLKRIVSFKFGARIWQKSYYDHIVRTQNEYDRIANYIYENPMYWDKDRYDGSEWNLIPEK